MTQGDADRGATSWASVPTKQSGCSSAMKRPLKATWPQCLSPLSFGAETASSWHPRDGANMGPQQGPSFPSSHSALGPPSMAQIRSISS